MYTNDLYSPVVLYSIPVALILTFTYYYLIDRPSTAKLSVWVINLVIGGIIAFIIAYVSANNDLTEIFASVGQPVPASFSSDMVIFSLINAMWTIILMVLLSLVFKWKSTNSSYIPF